MRRIFKRLLNIIGVVLFLFSALLSYAQNKSETQKDSVDVNAPQAIPVVNIIGELEIAKEKLADIQRKIRPNASIKNIDSLYPIYKNFINIKRKQAKSFVRANPNKQKANKLLDQWNRYLEYLKSWQTSIDNNFERNSIILEDVIFREKTWELSLEASKEQNLPQEIINTINQIKRDYSAAREKIINQNNEELVLVSKLDFQISVVKDVIEDIKTIKTSHVYDLLYKRQEALWNTSFKSQKLKEINDEEAIFKNIKIDFLKTFKNTIILCAIFIVIIFALIQYLKKGAEIYPHNQHTTYPNIKDAMLYKKSGLIVFFISVLLVKMMLSNLPDLANDLITLLLLFSIIPIVNPFILPKFKNIVYLVIVFYILDRAKTYIWFESYLYRLYLLFEALLVIGSLYYFTHPYRAIKKLSATKLTQFIVKLTPVLYVLALVSIISNVLGYTNLTDLSLKICTEGIVLSLLFYCILLVLNDILHATLHRHYGSKENFDVANRLKTEKKLKKYTRLLVFVFWVLIFLRILDFLSPIGSFLKDSINEPYTIGSISITIGAVLTFLLILILSFILTKFVSFILDDGSHALIFLNLPKGIPAAISVVLRYIILGFGIVFAISSLGVDLSKFNLMAGALGLGIGFGLQNVISNFVSGLILIFERPILAGDTVEVNNLMGKVKTIGVRSSKVSTFDGADVVVPNNNLVSNELINWTLSSSLKRVEILIGTSYDSDPNKVLELLLECANNYPELIKEPAPAALFSDFGDSSLNFRLRFWVHFSLGLQAKSDVSIAIYNSFKEHNIEIPFPQQDVHIIDVPDQKKDEKT